MKKRLFFLIVFILFLYFPSHTSADSSYVLPYPSAMPGSIMYKPKVVFDNLLQYWYFGNIGQFTYNLKQADKYLVEAKTLFEYKQYLLGYTSLKKSDEYFVKIPLNLAKAKKEGKDITEIEQVLKTAEEKHVEVLTKFLDIVPSEFAWQPEKGHATLLLLKEAVEESLQKRTQKK